MRPSRRFSRAMASPSDGLRLALAGFLLFSGLSCEIKSYLFFTPPPIDSSAIPDIDKPRFFNLQPSYSLSGPFRIRQVVFSVEDSPSSNGGPISGLDNATVRAAFLPNLVPLPLTSTGNQYIASFPQIADGTYTVQLSAKDKAGNLGTSNWSFTLDNTPPLINVTPPAPVTSNAPSLQIALNGTVTDANPGLGNVSVYKVGPSGDCANLDKQLIPVGTGPGFVSKNSFDFSAQIQFAISYTVYNGVPAAGPPATATYCNVVRADDTAKGADGAPSPNETLLNVPVIVNWTPVAPSTGSLIGRVTSGGPVTGATMTAGGRTATTGVDGSYRIDGVTAGAQTIAVSNLPAGVTCTPSSKTVTVIVITDVNVDFTCSGFIITYVIGGYNNDMPGVSSIVCQPFGTSPTQANVGWSAILMGPGVQGTGQYNGTTSSAGTMTLKGRILQFGNYFWLITVLGSGNVQSTSQTVTVVAGGPTANCVP